MYSEAGSSHCAIELGIDAAAGSTRICMHLNSVEYWRQCWNKDGLTDLFEGFHSGRPPKWNETQPQALRDLANQQGGTAGALLHRIGQSGQQPAASVYTIQRYLKNAQMRYKRCRYSFKKNGMQTPSTTPER
jgi:transposase